MVPRAYQKKLAGYAPGDIHILFKSRKFTFHVVCFVGRVSACKYYINLLFSALLVAVAVLTPDLTTKQRISNEPPLTYLNISWKQYSTLHSLRHIW